MARKRSLASLVLGVACAPQASLTPAAPVERRPTLAYSLPRGAEGDALLGWSFDRGPFVPCTARGPVVEAAWGAAGTTPRTTAYLPLDEGCGEQLASGGSAKASAVAEGCEWGEGRFGGALELRSPDARIVLRAERALLVSPWSLHLWVRPAGARGGALASAPGVLQLDARDDLRCRLRIELEGREPLTLVSREPLAAGAWNRVSVVHDGPDLPQIRLVVNRETIGALRPEGAAAGAATELVLGAAGPERRALACVVDDVLLEARAATSAECIEAYESVAPPGERVLALRYPGRTEEVRLWSGALSEPELRGDAWRAGELHHLAPFDGGLRFAEGDWERDRPLDPPLARTTHPTVFLGAHRALVFGGETRDSHLSPMVNTSDTWIYRIDERRWEEVQSELAPSPRCHQPAAYSPDHDVVLYSGGWCNDGRCPPTGDSRTVPTGQVYGDTWLFDCARGQWRRSSASGRPRSDSTLVYHPPTRRFVEYASGPLFAFDPETETWEALPRPRVVDARGEPTRAPPGGSTQGGYDPATGLIFLFGSERARPGADNEYGNPTMVYDVAANVLTVRAPDPAPPPRARCALAYHEPSGEFVVFGGVRGQFEERWADLWTYHVGEDRWTRREASNTPSARGGYYGMAYDPELDVFLLPFGRHAGTRFLNDVWRLRFDPSAVARATYVFDRAGHPGLDRVHVDWSGPEGAACEASLAVSPDAVAWTPVEPGAAAGGAPSAARFVKVALLGRGAGLEVRGLALAAGDAPAPEGARRIVLHLPPAQ